MEGGMLTKGDARYPALLKQIPGAPKQLYYKGRWDDSLFRACLAVVGTRQITSYGKRVVEQMVGEVAASGVTIVSGFMYGVDAAAHAAALEVGGRTIAVMPCGIERIHPEYQENLYRAILEEGGLVVSEYEGDSQPVKWNYPQRNRIVAGLSHATLVVEAGEKSGSLITANLARKFKRTLFAVPGPITSSVSRGTIRLLQEGAIVGESAETILAHYRRTLEGFSGKARLRERPQEKQGKSSGLEDQILETLQREAMGADTLARSLGVAAARMGTTLSLMQLNGLIYEEGGYYYVN